MHAQGCMYRGACMREYRGACLLSARAASSNKHRVARRSVHGSMSRLHVTVPYHGTAPCQSRSGSVRHALPLRDLRSRDAPRAEKHPLQARQASRKAPSSSPAGKQKSTLFKPGRQAEKHPSSSPAGKHASPPGGAAGSTQQESPAQMVRHADTAQEDDTEVSSAPPWPVS